MASRQKMIADLLFGVQIVGAVFFCGGYALRSLYDVTGTSIAYFLLSVGFLLFHLWLAIGAHRASPSRVSRQAVATYVVWFILYLTLIVVAWVNPAYIWNEKDTATFMAAAVLTIAVVILSVVRRLSVTDPMIKASFAIVYKSVPQVLLAWKFLAEGATGTPAIAIAMGHVTVLVRLGQLYFLVREAGWDRNRVWLTVSEACNEFSWLVATLAWFAVT